MMSFLFITRSIMLSGVMILLLGMALSSPVDHIKGKSCVQVFKRYFYIFFYRFFLAIPN